MGHIGFIKDEEENNKEALKDKLYQKKIKVIWVTPDETADTTDEETKEEIEAVDSKEIETTNSIEDEKEELNSYLNLSILFQLINRYEVTMANAMRFAVDKEFCDRFLANKTKSNNAGVHNELKNNRLIQLEDTFTKVRNRLARRIKKIKANNNSNGVTTIDLILSGGRIFTTDTSETDIKYIKKGIKQLKDTLKEMKEISEFINYNERGMVIIIKQFEDTLKRL